MQSLLAEASCDKILCFFHFRGFKYTSGLSEFNKPSVIYKCRHIRYPCGLPEIMGYYNYSIRLLEAEQKLFYDRGALYIKCGAGLIKRVVENSSVPVIETGVGICHIYIDDKADTNMATKIIINAKTTRPAVCNSVETVLIHQDIADEFLPKLCDSLKEHKVEIRGCEKCRQICPDLKQATDEDWATEYGDLILSVKIVADVAEAIDHINTFGSGHSEAIITDSYQNALSFQQNVDAAAVYVNASTRFTDGNEFGFGAEIGISTQKLHARGPMGLEALTTMKYLIYGEGQIR